MGGVVGHALKIGLEYMDKIKESPENCSAFNCPVEPDTAYKSILVRIVPAD